MRLRAAREGVSLLLAAVVSMPLAGQSGEPKPYFDARTHLSEYAGPDSGSDAPGHVTEVRIGYFGPSNPADPGYGTLWQAARLAITEANRQGGNRGTPFRLVPAWSENPWGTGVRDLARLVYQDHVWAIIGGVDGPSTHLAEQVVAKARLPLIGPVSTDKSVNFANVPWMFSVAPSDRAIADALAAGIVQCCACDKLVLTSASDHDSHLLADELRKSLSRLTVTPARAFAFSDGAAPLRPLVRQILAKPPSGVIVIAGPRRSARLVMLFRENGYHGPIFAGPASSRPVFRRIAKGNAEGVIVPLLVPLTGRKASSENRPANEPLEPCARLLSEGDFAAMQTYDAVRLAVRAIRQAGLNRVRIGQTIRQLAPYEGLSGPIVWNGLGRNQRPTTLAIVRDGRLTPILSVEKAVALLPH